MKLGRPCFSLLVLKHASWFCINLPLNSPLLASGNVYGFFTWILKTKRLQNPQPSRASYERKILMEILSMEQRVLLRERVQKTFNIQNHWAELDLWFLVHRETELYIIFYKRSTYFFFLIQQAEYLIERLYKHPARYSKHKIFHEFGIIKILKRHFHNNQTSLKTPSQLRSRTLVDIQCYWNYSKTSAVSCVAPRSSMSYLVPFL